MIESTPVQLYAVLAIAGTLLSLFVGFLRTPDNGNVGMVPGNRRWSLGVGIVLAFCAWTHVFWYASSKFEQCGEMYSPEWWHCVAHLVVLGLVFVALISFTAGMMVANVVPDTGSADSANAFSGPVEAASLDDQTEAAAQGADESTERQA